MTTPIPPITTTPTAPSPTTVDPNKGTQDSSTLDKNYYTPQSNTTTASIGSTNMTIGTA